MKAILLDDERLALDYLEKQLLKISDIHVAGKYQDPLVAKNHILSGEIDLVFLDINLPEINGLELAEQILEAKPRIHIIFVTAYDEYAVKAFEFNALDYLVKPVRAERLEKTLQRVLDRGGFKEDKALPSEQPIRMCVLQQVLLEASDGQLGAIHWRTTKAQELFLYLLQYRGQLVRKSLLIELLWPEYEPSKVNSLLYTAVYHIRKTLKPFGYHFQISNTTDGYMLNKIDVMLDVEEWENKIVSGRPISSDTIDYYKDSMQLYTGDYLQQYDYWWAESERHRLKTIWLSTAIRMAEWYCEFDDPEKAIALYLEICRRDPHAEEIYFSIMKIYASLGNHLSVNRQYRKLVAVLMDEFNERPSPYIEEWYMEWKKSVSMQ